MEAKLRRAFAPWPKGPSAKKVAAAFAGPKPGFYFVGKDDVNRFYGILLECYEAQLAWRERN